jgi:mannose-6-phosphate isomerase-like protein (cupin superfamily)
MQTKQKARVLGPKDGEAGFLTAMGVRFMVSGQESRGGFSLVEHPMPPRALAAPLHRHSREDEYTYVIEGRIGVVSDGVQLAAKAGDLVFKPRDQWHTFWNLDDTPSRVLEIISPSGFEGYFREMVALPPTATPADRGAIAAKYGLEVDRDSIPQLCAEHGVRFAPPPQATM